MTKFRNRVAVVSGASSGIGMAIANVLLQGGAKVFNLDINDANDSDAVSIFCDVTDHGNVSKVFRDIYDKEGQIDILVNNAGVSHIGKADTTEEEDFDRIFKVNVKGVYNCLHACIPYMKDSGGGIIINMSSVAAEVALPDRFAYSMSKGAVSTMTLSVAKDYLEDHIRCVGIAPGRVHTPFVDNYLAKHYPGKEKEMFSKLAKTQPIGRMGDPEEIAHLVAFLCSKEAAFITGTIYPIDGGFIRLNT